MSSIADHASLCRTCSKAASCRLSPQGGRIVCCDAYDGPDRVESLNATALGSAPEVALTSPPLSTKGLCPTCARRSSCARRDESFGVWRCKDYR